MHLFGNFLNVPHLAIKAAATVLILECLNSAITVSRFPATPIIIVMTVITPAVVKSGREYLEEEKKIM